jgi:cytochrome c553
VLGGVLAAASLQLCLAGGAAAQTTPVGPPGGADAVQLAIGQRIYREGIGASGEPIKAIGAAQAALGAKDVACAACHRRSGYGTTEGRFTIRPITGPALFDDQTVVVRAPRIKAQMGTRQRPAYTPALLARAIRSGTDSSGNSLDALMPRYALTDDEIKALSAYLGTLSAQPSPGVGDEEIHFATVLQPGVAPERRRAMLDIMELFFKDKGANVRLEEQRRDAGTMRMYRAYRKWVLHVWDLTGPSDTWRAQLESYYRAQPVFALIGGLGDASWQPIHEFNERMELPGVFAQVDLPGLAGANQYNLYFSRGVTLEAQVLAKYMRDQNVSDKVVQVYRRDDAVGLAAAAAFKGALSAGTTLQDVVLDGSADEAFWRRLSDSKPGAVVLWLGSADIAAAQAVAGGQVPLYLSFDLLDGRLPAVPARLGENVRLVYPSDLPPKHDARLLRTKIWLHGRGIPITNEAVQINTQFTMTVVNDAVGHIMDSFSRDFFIERIEHVVAQTPTPSLYQSVSLGPGQRFAAKGSSIVQVMGEGPKTQFKALSGWIVP